MIEINLLPPEFRVQERTPLGLFLTIVAGVCVVCTIGIYGIQLSQDLRVEQDVNMQKTQEKERWLQKKKEVDDLREQISIAQKRQETIINISQTKIMWSQKLCQLGRIMADYPQFWIDGLVLDRTGLVTTFRVANEDITKIVEFEEAVQNDASFWYHFKSFDANSFNVGHKVGIETGPKGPPVQAASVITFATKLPLR
jgi:hypothetical protein